MEEGIEILQTRGKPVGSKKNKKKASKVSTKKVVEKSTKRSVSGYQCYVSEVMKNGIKMGEAATNWKSLNDLEKQIYKDKAILMTNEMNLSTIDNNDNNNNKKKVNKSNSKDDNQSKRPLSGYQIYVSEMMKNGMKMSEAATSWKLLNIENQDIYKNKAMIESNNDNSKNNNNNNDNSNEEKIKSIQKNNLKIPIKNDVKRPISGYQLYVSEVMKNGIKMGEAATNWKLLNDLEKQEYKNKAMSSSTSTDSSILTEKEKKNQDRLSPVKKTQKTGYQCYVSEVMKNGIKMGEAASKWKNMSGEEQEIYKNKAKLN